MNDERKAELVERVRKEWDRVFTPATESAVDVRLAHTAVDALAPELAESVLDKKCSLCHIPLSTGPCPHLLEFDDGRVAMQRTVWEGLVQDRLRLRDLEPELAERDSLVDALQRYGRHQRKCPAWFSEFPCRCGFQAILDGINK